MVGSPPPWRAAMMMARLSLLHSLPRLASMAAFLCLIVAQWEWPDMVYLQAGQAIISAHSVYATPRPAGHLSWRAAPARTARATCPMPRAPYRARPGGSGCRRDGPTASDRRARRA